MFDIGSCCTVLRAPPSGILSGEADKENGWDRDRQSQWKKQSGSVKS